MGNRKAENAGIIHIEDYEIAGLKYIKNKEGIEYYNCLIIKGKRNIRYENIFLSKETVEYLVKLANYSSVEELIGLKINTLMTLIMGSLEAWPIFLGIGLNGTFILLNEAKDYYKDEEFNGVVNTDELSQKLNAKKFQDHTLDQIMHQYRR